MKKTDREIVRELAKEYAEIAARPALREKEKLFRAVNDLKPVRPVVLIDELPWHELNGDGSLTLRCEDGFCRRYEEHLRKSLYKQRHFPADMAMPEHMEVGRSCTIGSIGVSLKERVLSKNDGNHIVSHEFEDQLATEEAVDAVHLPEITAHPEKDRENLQKARELFDGIMPVYLMGSQVGWAPWDSISYWRGVEPLLMDLYDRPERMHRLMKKLLEIQVFTMEKMAELGLFGAPTPYIHCTAGYASDLAPGTVPIENATVKNVWGRGTAQIFAHVSPEMHDEFDIAYEKEVMDRCGLTYYGCCEPLHDKIEIVEKIKNLRKISITPWANPEIAAEKMGDRFVLASKPNPAFVAVDVFDEGVVRREITRTLDACKKNGTPCEFVIKDISTANFRPQNLVDWEKTVMDTVLGYNY